MRRAAIAGGLLAAAVCLVLPDLVSAQRPDTRPDLGMRSWFSEGVPPLQIVGAIFDADTGVGLESAQVYLRGSSVGALADESGRFSLQAPRPGSYVLVAELIGYRTMSTELNLQNQGAEVQIATEERPLTMCGMMVCPYPGCGSGVSAEVRDLETGIAPQVEVTLTVTAGGETASSVGVAPALDSAYLASRRPAGGFEAVFDSVTAALPVKLHAGGALGSDAAFDVRVEALGYHPWEATGVWVLPRECLPDMSATLKVWLQPVRD